MKEPTFTKATDGNCGMYAVYMALSSYGYDINADDILRIAMENGLSISGELYRTTNIIKLIDILKDIYNININLDIIEFDTAEELENIIAGETVNNYILLPYYAFQGVPITSLMPNMKRGHWAVIYDIKGSNIFGKQSNSKADALNVLKDVDVKKIFKSNTMLDNIKVNMGKYNKCNINIPKKKLVDSPRCGLDVCEYNQGNSSNCIFFSDIAYKAFVIRRIN